MKKIIPAERVKHMEYAIRDLVVEAKKLEKLGHKILYLNIGDPGVYDFPAPQHMVDAMNASHGRSHSYCDSYGIKEAREAIANESKRLGINGVTEDDVLLSTGSSEAILFATAALLNAGENLLIPNPSYPLYASTIYEFSGKPVFYMQDEDNDWKPDLDDMRKKINEKTKAIVLIDPNNPTGSLCDKSTLKEIVNIAAQHNMMIYADEAYSKMVLDDNEKHIPIASLTDEVPILTFGSLSKNYFVPGWRVGWTVFSGPKECISDYQEAVAKMTRARLCSPHPQQYAVKAALEGPQTHIKEYNKKLRERRDITYKRLNEIKGLSCVKPKAAFYAFPRLNFDVKDDKKFILDLLKEENVLFVHGSGFSQGLKNAHFRVVFLPKPELLNKAYDSLERFIKRNYLK